VILKSHPLRRFLSMLREREDLVPAAVGENRSVPTHEIVQTAKMLDHVEPGPNEQVIGVPENDLRLQLAQLTRTNALHAALRSYRHKRRCVDHAMRGCQPTASRF